MPLLDDLLTKGYLPENMPPAFQSGRMSEFLTAITSSSYLSSKANQVRPATYNASRRGLARRTFAAVHPTTAYDLAKFASAKWQLMADFFAQSGFSLSTPSYVPNGDRALKIHSHSELESVKLRRLSRFRFIANTDIARFYHSIYTHSIPWAYHGKCEAKKDRKPASAQIWLNRADYILRCGQDGQSIGIPVGPDASRLFAETIGTAIDLKFQERCDVDDYHAVRHVDDVWIGANTHADAEKALWRYREAIRHFELDINDNKTKIYSENFRFSDGWPTEIAAQLDYAIKSPSRYVPESPTQNEVL